MIRHRWTLWKTLIVVVGLSLVFGMAEPLLASTVIRLAWDANTEPDLAGYRIRYGTSPGTYTQVIEVGNVTSYEILDLASGVTYYFVVHAYDLAGNESPASNEVAGEPTVIPDPVLSLSLSDAPDPVVAGETLTYTFNYTNTGNEDTTGVLLTDTVPANTTFVSATGGGTESGGVVTWNLGVLAVGASGSVQMVVQVDSPLPNGALISNDSYSIVSNETAPVNGTPVSTTVASSPVLSISKAASLDPVPAGTTLTYTLSYTNTGNEDASGVFVTDTVPANTTFASATGGGTVTGGVVTWNIDTLGAGASGSVDLTVQVNSPLPNGTLVTNATYGIDSNETAPLNGTPVSTTVASSPVLSLSKSASPDPVPAGDILTYTLNYTNTGNEDATGVFINDTVPTNTTFVSATGGGTETGGVVTWNIDTLPVGFSGLVRMEVQVNSPLGDGTIITNDTYGIVSNETAPSNGAPVSTTVVTSPVLSIYKTASPDPVPAGGTLTYTLNYANAGNQDATGVLITDTVPANTTFVSATGGGTEAGGVVTWNVGPVNISSSGNDATCDGIDDDCDGLVDEDAGVGCTGGMLIPAGSAWRFNDTGTDLGSTWLGSTFDDSGWSSGPAQLGYGDGDEATVISFGPDSGNKYRTYYFRHGFNVVNPGAFGSLALRVLRDDGCVVHLNGVEVARSNMPSGAITFDTFASSAIGSSGESTWHEFSIDPDLLVSGNNVLAVEVHQANRTSSDISFDMELDGTIVNSTTVPSSSCAGSVQMVVQVDSPLPNGTLITNDTYGIESNETAPVNGTSVSTTVGSSPVLSISKTASPDPVPAGGTLTYTLDYTNTGNDDATGVFITDTLPANTTFVSATSGGTESGAGGVVTWNTGTLGAGASGSVQMVVQVDSPLPNGTLITNDTYGIDSNETAPVSGTSVSSTAASSPVLFISKTASLDPVPAGGTLTYTLDYTNTGNENATGVFVTDAVPTQCSCRRRPAARRPEVS
jgi:uncharacterized repeat protein (TIGR01451 family)